MTPPDQEAETVKIEAQAEIPTDPDWIRDFLIAAELAKQTNGGLGALCKTHGITLRTLYEWEATRADIEKRCTREAKILEPQGATENPEAEDGLFMDISLSRHKTRRQILQIVREMEAAKKSGDKEAVKVIEQRYGASAKLVSSWSRKLRKEAAEKPIDRVAAMTGEKALRDMELLVAEMELIVPQVPYAEMIGNQVHALRASISFALEAEHLKIALQLAKGRDQKESSHEPDESIAGNVRSEVPSTDEGRVALVQVNGQYEAAMPPSMTADPAAATLAAQALEADAALEKARLSRVTQWAAEKQIIVPEGMSIVEVLTEHHIGMVSRVVGRLKAHLPYRLQGDKAQLDKLNMAGRDGIRALVGTYDPNDGELADMIATLLESNDGPIHEAIHMAKNLRAEK